MNKYVSHIVKCAEKRDKKKPLSVGGSAAVGGAVGAVPAAAGAGVVTGALMKHPLINKPEALTAGLVRGSALAGKAGAAGAGIGAGIGYLRNRNTSDEQS